MDFNIDEKELDPTTELYPVIVRRPLADMDRDISFFTEIVKRIPEYSSSPTEFINTGTMCGGYVPLSLARKNVYTKTVLFDENEYIKKNISQFSLSIEKGVQGYDYSVLRIEKDCFVTLNYPIKIIVNYSEKIELKTEEYLCFTWIHTLNPCDVYIHKSVYPSFYKAFSWYICEEDNTFSYDNLISLVIMVKNAGEEFREVLKENLPYIDRWTVLDTGSTDSTRDIVREVLSCKEGILYEEPFVNFRDTRNRSLDLADKSCVFHVILDDTYVLRGELRKFLTLARTDSFADSYSIYIKTDVLYFSNRIIKTEKNLRYIKRLHETIEPNVNCGINLAHAYITENLNGYMKERTENRKEYDLQILFEEHNDEPDEPRHIYYIAETYLCLKKWEDAYKWYATRAGFTKSGFDEEIQDSKYKMAVISHLYLRKDWNTVCMPLYVDCYECNPKRAEALYMIATYYEETKNTNMAFMFFKEAFLIVENSRIDEFSMNIKLNMYHNYIPYKLLIHCYKKDNELALSCIEFGEKNSDNLEFLTSYKNFKQIYSLLSENDKMHKLLKKKYDENKKTILFHIDGGWDKWDGETYHKKGLGGSESFAVNFSEQLVKRGFTVLLMCDCEQQKEYNGVRYVPITTSMMSFLTTYKIDACFVNRYSVYLPLMYAHKIPTYFVMHDIGRATDIIIKDEFLRGVLCMSNWHANITKNTYPHLSNLVRPISHGINTSLYKGVEKHPYSFIYSSFPDRGLIHLLKMFPKITERYPNAILNVFCNTKLDAMQDRYKELMDEIDELIMKQSQHVHNHGWVNSTILRYYWKTSRIWLYPCVFMETACLTAIEAAASKTLVITTPLAGLNETAGDRAIQIVGNPATEEWQNDALNAVFSVLNEQRNVEELIERNYNYALSKDFSKIVPEFEKEFNL